mmetsp:Transcript_21731/g.68226  ORF Transcript_21731/g.68226 Transcript_21731/m.68226 type:complete len:143 (+) Transcript_21731:78-506(+)
MASILVDIYKIAVEVIATIDKMKDNVEEARCMREYISALVDVWHKVPTDETSEVFRLVADAIESARALLSEFTIDESADKMDKAKHYLSRVLHKENDGKKIQVDLCQVPARPAAARRAATAHPGRAPSPGPGSDYAGHCCAA